MPNLKYSLTAVQPVKRFTGFTVLYTVLALALSACGGGADSQSRPAPNNPNEAILYEGPSADTDDILAFKDNLWVEISPSAVCGRCHRSDADNAQSPHFADWLDINYAYNTVISNNLINTSNPADSRLVTKVAEGHNCWLASSSQCAEAMTGFIDAWVNGSNRGETEVSTQLRDVLNNPPVLPPQAPQFFLGDTPPTSYAGFYNLVRNTDTANCVRCHSSSAQSPITPYFADPNQATAYNAARTILDLNDVQASRPYVRVNGGHNCWTNSCTNDANTIAALITAMHDEIEASEPPEQFSAARISTKMDLDNGIPVSSGNRHETHQIALYEFKSGVESNNASRTIYDTSGVSPAMDLTIHGDSNGSEYTWLGNWGIRFNGGWAQASVATSRKLYDLIRLSGQYTVEAWLVPSNVADSNKSIIEYGATLSQNNIDRNFGLGQNQSYYDFFARNSALSNNDGEPRLTTNMDDDDLQASLQHVVITYDQNNGRRIYVNGEFTGDDDENDAGPLLNWSTDFHVLSIGAAPSGTRNWSGAFRLLSFHDRALTADQIRQNYAAEVGEKQLLPFKVDHLLENGTVENYVVFEVSKYDDSSYLFRNPRFINVDQNNPNYVPESLPLRGLHLGMNGQRVSAGQAYNNISYDNIGEGYTPQNGLLLSNIDTVIQIQNLNAQNRPADIFFLIFEDLGNFNFASLNTGITLDSADQNSIPPLPTIAADNIPSRIGLRTFDEINVAMAEMTGINNWQTVGGNIGINTIFNTYRRQFPAVEKIETFSSSQQMAIAQLAMSYCNELVRRETDTDNPPTVPYFAGFSFAASNSTQVTAAFSDLNPVINPLLEKMLNANDLANDDAGNGTTNTNLESQPSVIAIRNELDLLINGNNLAVIDPYYRAGLLNGTTCNDTPSCTERVKQIVTATCASTLGSAVMLIQ